MTARYSAIDNSLVLPGGEKIKCFPECKVLWSDNQHVQEGIDYELKQVPCPYFDDINDPVEYSTEAAPLTSIKSEDELWREVFRWIPRVFLHSEMEEAIADLKMNFIITKR